MRSEPVVSIKSADEPYLIERSEGYYEYQLPISVKGIVATAQHVLLVGNTRNEMELPGGKLEVGETPVECVEREIAEETALPVKAVQAVHAWVYQIMPSRHVFVLAYGMQVLDTAGVHLTASDEVGRAEWVPLDSLDTINLPMEYRMAIDVWLRVRRS